MVSANIVSRFSGTPPVAGENRHISDTPLYAPAELLELLGRQGCDGITQWTRDCIRDMQKWSLSLDDALELIELAVKRGRFLGAEWCHQKPGGPWAACDAYSLTRLEWIDHAHREMNVEYYVKFAIGKTGQILLLVSCHPSGS